MIGLTATIFTRSSTFSKFKNTETLALHRTPSALHNPRVLLVALLGNYLFIGTIGPYVTLRADRMRL